MFSINMPIKYIKITISSSKPGRYAQNGTVYIEIAMEITHACVHMHGESPGESGWIPQLNLGHMTQVWSFIPHLYTNRSSVLAIGGG